MEYTLRQFKKDDAGAVKDLILAILTKEYPFDKSAYSDSDLDRIGEVYGGEKESFFVIDESGQIVGTAGIKKESKDEALLRRFFVDTKHRRRGYGTQLLDRAINFCRDNGYKKIYFRCTDKMLDAMNLCLKKGFKEVENLEVAGFRIHRLVFNI